MEYGYSFSSTASAQFGSPWREGLCEGYRVSLERRVERGDCDLVCPDEELCEKVQGLLRDGAGDVCHHLGLDFLAVIEASVRTSSAGLRGIARTFQVLELAALNLYLWPWRREYRVVKKFSGMFTHLVKPALSESQVEELFGLLGYSAGRERGKEEELQLSSTPCPPSTLLRLAFAFFTASCECRLLLVAVDALHRGVADEQALVQERRAGCSLQRALENVQMKAEATAVGCTGDLPMPLTADVDMYNAPEPDTPEMGPTHQTCPLNGYRKQGHEAQPLSLGHPAPQEQKRGGESATPPEAHRRRAGLNDNDKTSHGLATPPIQHHGESRVIGLQTPDRHMSNTCSAARGCRGSTYFRCKHCLRRYCTDCWIKTTICCSCRKVVYASTAV